MREDTLIRRCSSAFFTKIKDIYYEKSSLARFIINLKIQQTAYSYYRVGMYDLDNINPFKTRKKVLFGNVNKNL